MQEILVVCRRYMAEFSVVNVATALHRIAKQPDAASFRPSPLFAELLARAESAALKAAAQPQELASMSWAVAKLRVGHAPLL
mmetsp:Transcript_73556/g.166709  ORF Transcript_73556/g.166709 Transcript_73556/m.166709 type:complete len:82 (+) Transcript_73556:314-559(+)